MMNVQKLNDNQQKNASGKFIYRKNCKSPI